MFLETSSLPVPFSPVISTHEFEGAALSMSLFRAWMAGEFPIISYFAQAFCRSCLFSSKSLLCSTACSTVRTTLSSESGFSRKS